MSSERDFLDLILGCEPDLESWKQRAESVEQPERGSDLAADDQVFPFHRISEVARTSLVISGENLRMAIDAIHQENLYPNAHFTPLRSALVGACQAVWILAPDDQTVRRDRGLCVIDELYRRSAQFHADTRTLTPGLTQAEVTTLDGQLRWIRGRRQQVAGVRVNRFSLNLTDDVIPSAAAVVYSDPQRQAEVSLLWRQMSGDAHVLGWSMFIRSTPGQTDRLTGLAEFGSAGSFSSIAPAFYASYQLLRRGWSLYDRRCEGRSA